MKKNKRLTALIGLGLGVIIFAGAAFANYNTSNGYEVGKMAVKGLLKNENYTMNAKISFLLDGDELASDEITELYDRNGDVKLNRTEHAMDHDRESNFKEYFQDKDEINIYNDEATLYSYNNLEDLGYMPYRGMLDQMSVANDDEKTTINKIIRFVELATDTLVGDLKNNIVYVSGDDDSSTYEMNLSTVQIPELVNAGLSAIFSAVDTENRGLDSEYKDPFLILGTDPVVKETLLKFTVDKEGRLTYAEVSAAAMGEGHEARVLAVINITDYGTTAPERVDVDQIPNLRRYSNDRKEYDSFTTETAATNKGYHVTVDGEVLDDENYVVGHVNIDTETGEGSVVID